jgi:hypothetical protein
MQSTRHGLARASTGALVVLCAGLVACSPTLDWREVRAPGAAVVVLMPCKPVAQQRRLGLAGTEVVLNLQACTAGGLTWGLVSADVTDPSRVAVALDELLAASARNVSAPVAGSEAFAPAGSTPNGRSRRARLAGTLPNGGPAQLESAVFTHGTWVFQATVLGEKADAEAAGIFFDSLRAVP